MFPLGGRIGNGLRICIAMLQTMSRFSNLKGKESRLKNNAVLVLTEKRKQCERYEFSYIWGLTKDNSQGDSLSESSEELLC